MARAGTIALMKASRVSALALTMPSMYRNSALRMPDGPRADVTTWVDRITPMTTDALQYKARLKVPPGWR